MEYDPRRGTAAARGARPIDFIADCFEGRRGVTLEQQLARVRAAHHRGADDAGGPADNVVFPRANPHLYRQFVGRGSYSLMLEHWYAAFPAGQLAVLCTDDLSPPASAAKAMRRLADFVGLDTPFDFEATAARGKFNAAHRRGYDQVCCAQEGRGGGCECSLVRGVGRSFDSAAC